MLPAGILESSIIPPADAISLAATLVPTIALTLGAIISMRFSRKFSIFCLFPSKLSTSPLNLITSSYSFSLSYLPVFALNDTFMLKTVEFLSH